MADGRQSLFQAESEEDKYEWVACMNYGSSFKTADVRIRSAEMAKKDIELTGIAAADFSRIRNANLGRFTIDRLMTVLGRLDRRVDVNVKVRSNMKRGVRAA